LTKSSVDESDYKGKKNVFLFVDIPFQKNVFETF